MSGGILHYRNHVRPQSRPHTQYIHNTCLAPPTPFRYSRALCHVTLTSSTWSSILGITRICCPMLLLLICPA